MNCLRESKATTRGTTFSKLVTCAGPDDLDRLAEFCRAGFFCMNSAATGFAAATMVQSGLNPSIGMVNLGNFLRSLRGLPPRPIPQGSMLDAFHELLRLLEILIDRARNDLVIRRVLQTLELSDCGELPPGHWKDRTAHAAALSLAEDVLHEILYTTIGIQGVAAANQHSVPKFEPTVVDPKHWPRLRQGLAKFSTVDIGALLQAINLELARGFTSASPTNRGPIVPVTKILFLAADAADEASTRIRLDKEVREFKQKSEQAPIVTRSAFMTGGTRTPKI